MVLHSSYLECVSESGICVSQYLNCYGFCTPPSCSGLSQGGGLRRNSMRIFQHMYKNKTLFALVQKHIVVSLPRTSYCYLISVKKVCNRVPEESENGSLYGIVPQSVVRFSPSEQSHFVCFTDTEEQNKRTLLTFWHANTLKDPYNKRTYPNLSSIEPRFQLLHVTIGLLTDCELEPNLV